MHISGGYIQEPMCCATFRACDTIQLAAGSIDLLQCDVKESCEVAPPQGTIYFSLKLYTNTREMMEAAEIKRVTFRFDTEDSTGKWVRALNSTMRRLNHW